MDSINDLVLSPVNLERESSTPLGRKVSGYLKYVTSGTPKVIAYLNFRAENYIGKNSPGPMLF